MPLRKSQPASARIVSEEYGPVRVQRPQQTVKMERPVPQSFGQAVLWPLAGNIVGGVMAWAFCTYVLHTSTPVAWAWGIGFTTVLGMIRAAYDEVSALVGYMAARVTAAYLNWTNNRNWSEVIEDNQYLINLVESKNTEISGLKRRVADYSQENQRLKEINERLSNQLTEMRKVQSTPQQIPYSEPVDDDDELRFVPPTEMFSEDSEGDPVDVGAHFEEIPDEGTEREIELARRLLAHCEQYGTLSKNTATRHSNFTNRDWEDAARFLGKVGAASKFPRPRGWDLIVDSTDEARALVDKWVAKRTNGKWQDPHVVMG